MSAPNSYLLTAPAGSGDLLGRGIPASKIIGGLKKIDKRIWTTKLFGEETCLWFGGHSNKLASKKISSIAIGVVPEFTQLGPGGEVIALGWRRLFEKCIKVAKIKRAYIENAFSITLDISGEDGFCFSCKKAGKLNRATSKGTQCSMHRQVLDTVAKVKQDKIDRRAMAQRSA